MGPEENGSMTGEAAIVSRPRGLVGSVFQLIFGLTGHQWTLTLIDQAVVSGASFLAGVIVGRACGKEEFGLFLLGASIINFLMEFQEATIWSPYTIFSARLTGSAHALYTGSTFIHQWAFSALSILILAGAGVFLSLGIGPRGLATVVWTLAAAGAFITFRECARRVCFANLWIKAALGLDTGAATLQLIGLLLIAYLGHLSASRAFVMLALGCALGAITWILWSRDQLAFSISRASSDLGPNWSFGKWVLGSYMAIFFSAQLYPWVLTGFHGMATVGTLAACLGVVALANPFLGGTSIFLGPKAAHAFAQGGIKELRGFVIKSTLVIGGVIGLFSAAIITFGERMVTFIYGPQYAGNGLIISLLALNTLISALNYAIYYGILATGRADLTLKINLIRLVLTLTLGFWLVKTYGLLGVALGFLIASMATITGLCVIFRRLFYSTAIRL